MRGAFLALALLLSAAGGAASGSNFEGVWKKCYEPGLVGVDEPDSGYLVIMADGKYYESSSSCCSEESSSVSSTYSVSGSTVTLAARRKDGSQYAIELRHRPNAKVVYFDNLKGAPSETEALATADDLNYAWCKVYPPSK